MAGPGAVAGPPTPRETMPAGCTGLRGILALGAAAATPRELIDDIDRRQMAGSDPM